MSLPVIGPLLKFESLVRVLILRVESPRMSTEAKLYFKIYFKLRNSVLLIARQPYAPATRRVARTSRISYNL